MIPRSQSKWVSFFARDFILYGTVVSKGKNWYKDKSLMKVVVNIFSKKSNQFLPLFLFLGNFEKLKLGKTNLKNRTRPNNYIF